MDATEFIERLTAGKKLINRKLNQFIYIGTIGDDDQTNFITVNAIITLPSDAYGISGKKVGIFYKGMLMIDIEPFDFEVYE